MRIETSQQIVPMGTEIDETAHIAIEVADRIIFIRYEDRRIILEEMKTEGGKMKMNTLYRERRT